MKNSILAIGVLLPFLVAACENQFSGGVNARIRFAAVQKSEDSKLSARSSGTEGLLIDSATISLQNIRLLVQNSNSQIIVGNTVFTGPYMINLVTRKSSPVIESAAVPAGTYFGLNAMLYVPHNTKYSMYVSGTYTLNDKWWKFFYTNSGSLTFQVIDSLGFTVDQAHPEIWVGIDVVSFFKGVDFSKAVADSGNVIRISESSNSPLAVAIQKNFILAATVSNNPATSQAQSSGGSSGGNSVSSGQDGSSGSSGTVTNSGSSGQDNKDTTKQKEKDKQKDKDKNGTRSKHDQKENNKTKDKNKDKNKDKDGH